MQKRVRKNSDFNNCSKKPKLDIPINNDQSKNDTNPLPSQYANANIKETETQSESFVRTMPSSSSAESSDLGDVNIIGSNKSINPVLKTFVKSDDSMEFKEVFQSLVQSDESEEHGRLCGGGDVASVGTPNSLHLQENSNSFQDSGKDSIDCLSNFKLLHRENDILIDFETNTSIDSGNIQHEVLDGSSICIPTENDLLLAETKDAMNLQSSIDPLKQTDDKQQSTLNKDVNTTGDKKDDTAKVSIGNTTVSVPLLKPVNFRRVVTNDGKSVPNIVRKVINIRGNKIKAPTIVQLSQVHLNQKLNSKVVQATLVGNNKIQLPNIGFKSSQGFAKQNFVQPSPMDVTTLPKQIFEDEMVFLDNVPQSSQIQSTEDSVEVTPIGSPSLSNKSLPKPKEQNSKLVSYEEQVTKSSPSYLNQYRAVETDSSGSNTTVTDSLPTSVAVSCSVDNTLGRMTNSQPKTSRKPLVLTAKTVGTSEAASGLVGRELLRAASDPKDNTKQIAADNTMIGKMLEDNFLLRKQIALAVQNNCNRFQLKVTKTTDDGKMKRNEIKTGESTYLLGQAKRPMTKPFAGQNPGNSEHLVVSSANRVDNKPNNQKSDETQNVLLKHLLQSSITQRSSPGCNQSIAPRKLATLRAPSLGVVSSLEDALARPVIPPVSSSSVTDVKPEMKILNKSAHDKAKKNPQDQRDVVSNVSKPRPEMISRETSFVSAFPPKPKNQTNSSEPERMTNVQQQQMTNQVAQTEITNPKSASLQTAPNQITPNNNYNSINLFKFFKQKEQTNSESPTPKTPDGNSNISVDQTKMLSPHETSAVDTKIVIKTEPDDAARSSPTVKTKLVKMEIPEQNIELRRKFKRDYQKHKRQMLLNKDPQTHQKKKSRKLSKATEDFDEFIENKVVQMKQMFVLEVLEPLLSTFLGICSVYGYNEKVRNQYPYQSSTKNDFGKTNLKNYVDFYSVKPYGPHFSDKAKPSPSFQNKFYDEEFSTVNQESCDKLHQFVNNLKHQYFLPTDNAAVVPKSPCNEVRNQSLLNMAYPGIKIQTNFEMNIDRMSPVLPLVNPKHFGVIKKKKSQTNTKKSTYGSMETTLVLKLSSFVAENILDILRDLDNLLNVYSPVSYKLFNSDKINLRKGLYLSRIKNLQKTESTNIQNFLNGTYKCCRNCHLTIICGIVGADSNSNIKKKILADSHFCDKFCCIQYKKKGKKFVVSKKRERCLQNNNNNAVKSAIIVNENNYCNNSNYKVIGPNTFWKPPYKAAVVNEDVNEIALKMRIAITISSNKDTRRCVLCLQKGDSFGDGSSRLLNYDVNKWVHLNCALWSNSVYETINGGLMNLELTMQQGLHQICSYCNQYGASIKCFKMRCTHMYHLPCAIKEQCVFYKNKTIHCASHAHRMEKKNELSSIRVRRRVYIERDENRQVAAVMHHLELSNLLRIGNLTFINVGQLLPHQLEAFHSRNYIYPIGYKIIRLFWSMKKLNKRCRYICSIAETNGRPEFVIQIQEQFENDVELRDISPKAVWQRVLDKIVMLRKGQAIVQLFTEFITGEDMFGLSEPSIVRILESLPGVESLTDYRFKYGRNPLLELPLALNPSGAARTEPKQKHIINWKKAHTQRTSSINLKLSLSPSSLVAGEVACPYSKQFVHSKSSQYRKMKQEWRNNVYLARSKIQGLGLYAARDLEKHTMVIEYIGQVIRTEVSELREKQYDLRNRGIYMFRLDEERVVDATLSGGLARYINHSCNPNCVTEIVDVDREYRIIIFAKRRINKGEELSYDYKFDIEDDANKISCMCEAPNCRKWMN